MLRGEPILIYNLYGQFEEIATLVADTLTIKGYHVTHTKTVTPGDQRLYILFGANVWEDVMLLPTRYIIYQLEQNPIKKWFGANYFARMQNAVQVWDYNLQNVEYLRLRGIDAIHVPIGYSRIFDPPLQQFVEGLDILFLGQLRNGYRQRIITALRAAGLSVATSNEAFGEQKKHLVGQAKLVLNLHYGHDALLEEARIIPLLAAGKVVISEAVSDLRYMELYKDQVLFARNTNELIATCKEWLGVPAERRREWGLRVRNWVTTQRVAANLFPSTEIEETPPTEIAYHASLVNVPANILTVLTDRVNHVGWIEWEAVRHYGRLTVMRRVR